jgi:hypothetical protein
MMEIVHDKCGCFPFLRFMMQMVHDKSPFCPDLEKSSVYPARIATKALRAKNKPFIMYVLQ